MFRVLTVLAFALPTVALAEDHHEAKAVEVVHYDAEHHDVVVKIDGHDVHLHTEHATVHGELHDGKHVDVVYEGDQAKEITVH